jgi:DNA polymerase III subunit epsilon
MPAPDRTLPLGDIVCTALDIEATGLHPERGDRIVSLAAVRVRQGRLEREAPLTALVNPGRSIPAASTRLHGITDESVAAAPLIETVLPELYAFAEGTVLVGHDVWLDLHFLSVEAARAGLTWLGDPPALDTALLARALHPAAPYRDLDALARELGVRVVGRHTALGDAVAAGEIFLQQAELLVRRGVRTLGDALDACRVADRGLFRRRR